MCKCMGCSLQRSHSSNTLLILLLQQAALLISLDNAHHVALFINSEGYLLVDLTLQQAKALQQRLGDPMNLALKPTKSRECNL